MLPNEICMQISSDASALNVAEQARELAKLLTFSEANQAKIATSVLEIARNIVIHAFIAGKVKLTPVRDRKKVGIIITAEDKGPGISDVDQVLKGGCSTSGGFGEGLGAVKRMMDELEIYSRPGEGTRIIAKKWMR